jgi:predicted RNase H-like HicB family nuclease
LTGDPDVHDMERVMTFTITLLQDEDGMFIAERPTIPGCMSQGATRDEAEQNIRSAIRECLEVRREQGLPLTIDVRQLEVPV